MRGDGNVRPSPFVVFLLFYPFLSILDQVYKRVVNPLLMGPRDQDTNLTFFVFLCGSSSHTSLLSLPPPLFIFDSSVLDQELSFLDGQLDPALVRSHLPAQVCPVPRYCLSSLGVTQPTTSLVALAANEHIRPEPRIQ